MFTQFAGTQNLALTAWLGVWAALLFGGFIFGKPSADNIRRIPLIARLGSSLALVLAAWSLHLFVRETPFFTASGLIAIGMTLGFVGDVFMAMENVIGGMVGFGLGHLAYIAAIFEFSGRLNLPLTLIVFVVWWLVSAVCWYFIVWKGKKGTGPLKGAALAYSLLLASTAGAATALAIAHGAFIPLAVGAALFLISDLIIAGEMFSEWRFPLIGDVIWLTYGPAQALIVFSTAAALQVSRV